jgi:uncharacterized protein (TIGR03435 family)
MIRNCCVYVGVFVASVAIAQPLAQLSAVERPELKFEVASIKPNRSNTGSFRQTIYPNGRLVATNRPLVGLIASAYAVRSDQVLDGPGWIRTERFDIEAKAEDVPGLRFSRNQIQLMLRTLLAERFGLSVRYEARGASSFALVTSRKDGRLGPQIVPSQSYCTSEQRPSEQRASPSPESPEKSTCGIVIKQGMLTGTSSTVSRLAMALSAPLMSPVSDRTGLEGQFDFDLRWADDPSTEKEKSLEALPLSLRLSIFTAIKEQLGLELRVERSQADVLVVEHVERPTPD